MNPRNKSRIVVYVKAWSEKGEVVCAKQRVLILNLSHGSRRHEQYRKMRWYIILLLLFLILGYLCLGAFVFMTLESDEYNRKEDYAVSEFRNFLRNKSCLTEDILRNYLKDVISTYRRHGISVASVTEGDMDSASSPWSYHNSLFFSLTVVSTIGYGNQAPVTFEGRLFVLFYAVFGIPLFGVLLVAIGGKIAVPVASLKKHVWMPKHRRLETGLKSFTVGITGLTILICAPAAVFVYTEGWTFGEGVYFVVITLSTIGFGDYMIGLSGHQNNALYRIFVAIWILLGLAWMAFLVGEVSYLRMKDKQQLDKAEENGDVNLEIENGKLAEEKTEDIEQEAKKEVENTKL